MKDNQLIEKMRFRAKDLDNFLIRHKEELVKLRKLEEDMKYIKKALTKAQRDVKESQKWLLANEDVNTL